MKGRDFFNESQGRISCQALKNEWNFPCKGSVGRGIEGKEKVGIGHAGAYSKREERHFVLIPSYPHPVYVSHCL